MAITVMIPAVRRTKLTTAVFSLLNQTLLPKTSGGTMPYSSTTMEQYWMVPIVHSMVYKNKNKNV